MTGRPKKPIPSDLEEEFSKHKSLRSLADHYGVHHKTVRTWLQEKGLEFEAFAPAKRPMPEDFPERVQRMTQQSLKSHYSARIQVIRRWQDELKAQGKPYDNRENFKPRLGRLEIELAVREQMSLDMVCKQLNIGHSHLMSCCDHYGIPILEKLANNRSLAEQLEAQEGEVYGDQHYIVLRGAALTIQSAIDDWSSRMGMKVSESSQCLPFDMDLLEEEMGELWEAISGQNRQEQLDALADIVYTCFNIAYRRNLPLSLALGEVHRSNETKTPNADGKPTKGDDYEEPDLKEVLRHWDGRQAEIKKG